jgi:hypothetical protein
VLTGDDYRKKAAATLHAGNSTSRTGTATSMPVRRSHRLAGGGPVAGGARRARAACSRWASAHWLWRRWRWRVVRRNAGWPAACSAAPCHGRIAARRPGL